MAVDDSFSKALLHFNGSDAATTFTDESGKTWTANGNAQLDTAQKKFGTASLLLDGTGDYLSTPDSADWDMPNIWTIDLQARFNDVTGTQCLTQQYQDGTHLWKIQKNSDNKLSIRFFNGGETGQFTTTSAPTINTDTWYHMAFVRDTGNQYIFLDGVSLSLTTNNAWSTNPTFAGSLLLGFDQDLGGNYMNGWIDEYRLSNGIARWTANFTPPTAEYGSVRSTAFFNLI